MKTNIIFRSLICGATLMAALTGCTEDDYKVYDTTQKDSVFFEYYNSSNDADSAVTYSYDYDVVSVHTINLPVTLMGVPKDYDRTIALAADPDSTTMREGVHYTIDDNVIRAGAVNGVIRINLLRDNDPLIQEQQFKLRLRVAENEDLRPVGDKAFTIVYSDIRPTLRPSWWLTWSPMPAYSYENAQLFFEYFHRLAPVANKVFYNEIIEAYGEYFNKASSVKGPLTMYESFFKNYVLIPLYKDHPEIEWQDIPAW